MCAQSFLLTQGEGAQWSAKEAGIFQAGWADLKPSGHIGGDTKDFAVAGVMLLNMQHQVVGERRGTGIGVERQDISGSCWGLGKLLGDVLDVGRFGTGWEDDGFWCCRAEQDCGTGTNCLEAS